MKDFYQKICWFEKLCLYLHIKIKLKQLRLWKTTSTLSIQMM